MIRTIAGWAPMLGAGLAAFLCPTPGNAAEDAIAQAVRAALDAGQPAMAMDLLGPEAGDLGATTSGKSAPHRALRIQVAAALGDAAQVQRLAGDDLSRWPAAQRGMVAWALGQVHAAAAEWPAAKHALLIAIDQGGSDAESALILLTDVAVAAGDDDLARHCAEIRWRRLPRTAAAAAAGVLLARLALVQAPASAQNYLIQVRALPGVATAEYTEAGILLCRLLLPRDPAAVLVLSEHGIASGNGEEWLMWRALALLRIDPGGGTKALAELPPELAQRQEILAARIQTADAAWDATKRNIALGQAAIAGGRWHEAQTLLTPLAATQPHALAAWVQIPGLDPGRFQNAPAAQTIIGAGALAEAWVRREQPGLALAVAGSLADRVVSDEARAESAESGIELTYWAWRSAVALADPRVVTWGSWLHRHAESDLMLGETAADLARRGVVDRQATLDLWLTATRTLPDGHPWLPAAIEAALRGALAEGMATPDALQAATRIDADFHAEIVQRSRFLQVQILLRAGQREAAQQWAERLAPFATAAQREKLARLLSSAEVEPTQAPGDTPERSPSMDGGKAGL